MKPIEFCGDSREVLKCFPDIARNRMGEQLRIVQEGGDPVDW